MDVTIRAAAIDDAAALGVVHVRAWQDGYRGMMSDEYLDTLSPASWADMWRQWFESDPTGFARDVIEADGRIAGFAIYGAERGTVTEPGVAELVALNVHPDHWRHGFGRRLLEHVTGELARSGYRRAVLWVVTENDQARRLYEGQGWSFEPGSDRVATVQGATVNEVRYTRDLGD